MKLMRIIYVLAVLLIIFPAAVITFLLKGDTACPVAATEPEGGEIPAEEKALTIEFQQTPFLLDGLTFVPVRELAGYLGLTLTWDAEQNALIFDDGRVAFCFETLSDPPGRGRFVFPSRQTVTNIRKRETEEITWPYYLENGFIFLPLRPLAQCFNWKLGWHPDLSFISLKLNPEKEGSQILLFDVELPFSRYFWPPPQRIAYLTFDDGPSQAVTPLILDILHEENIKATFFVVGERIERHPDMLLRIYEEGHTIGNHTYSHQPAVIFTGTKEFMQEIKKNEDLIHSVIGEKPTLVRMPYGIGFDQWPAYKRSLEKKGYLHVGWNVNSFDSSGQNVPAQDIIAEVKQQVSGKNEVIILFHDLAWKSTAEALPEVIRFLQKQGYFFRPLAKD